MTDTNRSAATGTAWDLPTRSFHWALVALVVLAWISGEAEGAFFKIHQLSGYGVFVAVVFRVIWGFVGTSHARFRNFLRPWPLVRAYARDLLALRPPATSGHNPIGGWMIVLLLSALFGVVATGLFAQEDGVGGPLAGSVAPRLAYLLAELHEGCAAVLPALVAVHVAGVVALSLLTGRNLIRSMVTGRPAASQGEGRPVGAHRAVPQWSPATVLAVSTAIVWLVVAR